jgi:glycosidase
MKKIFFLAFPLLVAIGSVLSQDMTIYPTHWWTGMKEPKLQLMVHGDGIKSSVRSVEITYPGVKVVRLNKVEGNNYLFIDLAIAPSAKPGMIKIRFNRNNAQPLTVSYELKQRNPQNGKTRVQGVTSKDFVYLMMPDRFSNGDPSNDIIPEYREHQADRNNKFSRHGGDFKGIEDHLDYLSELGVTTIWLTPVLENNMPLMNEWGNNVAGYHGYWFTDHYQVDKRFGGNEGYKQFCNTLHQKGMKVIQDAVYNHVGNYHWFVLDPPMHDWLNQWPAFQGPNHREEVLFDPYSSAYDKKIMLDGWFTPHLPDLNQRNPWVATYLIQHAIWSTEEYGIDGWRVDTYKYCDEKFLNNINVALVKEFPKVTVFGEAWVNTVIGNAYFTRNNINSAFKHNAEGVIDFQTCFAMLAGMNESFGWTNGVNKIYMTMAQDVVYKEPLNNCIFLDNHDMDRVYSVVDEDWKKLKMGLNWLLTLRGIPQLYYGTEVLMKNKKSPSDAAVREDFPGGWPDDKEKDNRFTKKGRSDAQEQAFTYTSGLANFRKTSSALTTGKTMQYIPKDGLYIYFRYDDKQTVMVITNTGDKSVKPDWNIYSERTKGFTQVRNVVTGKVKPLQDLEVDPKDSFVLELVK